VGTTHKRGTLSRFSDKRPIGHTHGLRNLLSRGAQVPVNFLLETVTRDGFTHRPWPRTSRFWGAPRNDLFYDDSMSTENLQNCSEA